jgi:hypothetical protein
MRLLFWECMNLDLDNSVSSSIFLFFMTLLKFYLNTFFCLTMQPDLFLWAIGDYFYYFLIVYILFDISKFWFNDFCLDVFS